jgi:undecaprenyl-diphosphatase
MDILQALVLGLVQALTEWLPLSSKTMDSLVYTAVFGGSSQNVVSVLLFLHLGTMLAAAIYFRKELFSLLRHFLRAPGNIRWQSGSKVGFILTALFMTGVVGVPLLLIEKFVLPTLEASALLILMGAGLILTGFLLTSQHKHRWRTAEAANWKDGILTGALQGLAALPGVSRAGSSTTGLIWSGFDAEAAFHLSFLLSIPTVFLTECVFWAAQGGISAIPFADGLMLVATSFAFGYLTIGVLLKLVHKLNVAWLAFAFGMLMLSFGLFGVG